MLSRPDRFSGRSSSVIPFFNDKIMDDRMTMIRGSINNIRERWKDFDRLIDELEEFIFGYAMKNIFYNKDIDLNRIQWNELREAFLGILQKRRNWIDLSEKEVDKDFNAVKYYTNDSAYKSIFYILNEFFRTEDLGDRKELLESAVFLVELINIDLYNYVKLNDHVNNYTGTVYRGMPIGKKEDGFLRELSELPALERRISVPLSLVSSSTDLVQAVQFSSTNADDRPILFRIRVESLDTTLINEYNTVFPDSKVSSICAVPIQELSFYNHEEEVLLRGPFFHLLNAYPSIDPQGKAFQSETGKTIQNNVHIYDLVMVNINRDHPSTTNLGTKGKMARDAIIHMVNLTRMKYAISYAEKNKDLREDLEQYKRQYEESHNNLEKLRKEWS